MKLIFIFTLMFFLCSCVTTKEREPSSQEADNWAKERLKTRAGR